MRPLARSDAPSYVELVIGGYGEFERMLGLDRAGAALYEPFFRPGIWVVLRLLRMLRVSPVEFEVAVDGARIVATTGLTLNHGTGYIFAVSVRPEYRRRGLAGRLLGWSEERIVRRGGRWALLDVEEANTGAVALYSGRGYRVVEKVDWFRAAPAVVGALASVDASAVWNLEPSGRKAAAAWLARVVPAGVTEVATPTPRRLTHLQTLGAFPGSRSAAWGAGPVNAPVGYLTGSQRAKGEPGVLILAAMDPHADPALGAALVVTGARWLLSEGASSALVAVPDHAAAVGTALERLGFHRELSTLAMARPLASGGAPSAGPKGP